MPLSKILHPISPGPGTDFYPLCPYHNCTLEGDELFVIFTLSLTGSSRQVACLNENEGWQNMN